MSRPSFTRRDRAAVVDSKREFFGPDPEPDEGSEGGDPDARPAYLCDCNFSAGCLECAWENAKARREQEAGWR